MKPKTLNAIVIYSILGGLIWSLIFCALKLAHVISWSWWIVWAPFIAPIILLFVALIYVYQKTK